MYDGVVRIVSLAPSNTELLFALGLGDQVVGVTAFCDYPPEARMLPRVGGWTTANLDRVRRLAPDLVVTSTFLQGESEARFAEDPFAVLHLDPRRIADIPATLLNLGEATDTAPRAAQLARWFVEELERLAARVRGAGQPRVYAEEWPKPPMVSGNWVPDLVTLAGGAYGLRRAGEPSEAIQPDAVLAYDPEVIVLNYCGFGNRADVDAIRARPGWNEISAVRANRVHVVDDSLLNRPSLRLLDGLRALQAAVHPELE